MDDIIIIVLTLIFTIVAAVNQSRKKKEPGGHKIPDFWKEILQGEVVPERPVQEEIPLPVTPLRPPVRMVPPVYTAQNHNIPVEEGIRNDIITGMIGLNTEEQDESREKETLMEDFSFRKAFVFSEIINPKYFSTI